MRVNFLPPDSWQRYLGPAGMIGRKRRKAFGVPLQQTQCTLSAQAVCACVCGLILGLVSVFSRQGRDLEASCEWWGLHLHPDFHLWNAEQHCPHMVGRDAFICPQSRDRALCYLLGLIGRRNLSETDGECLFLFFCSDIRVILVKKKFWSLLVFVCSWPLSSLPLPLFLSGLI